MIAAVTSIACRWGIEIAVADTARPFGTVALSAGCPGVAARERPAREIMIKGSFVKLRDTITAAAMFPMTIMTFCGRRVAAVVTPALINPLRNLLMTVQAI